MGSTPSNMNEPALHLNQPGHHTSPVTSDGIEPIPAALRASLDAEGIVLKGDTLETAELYVVGRLAQISRLRYGIELGEVFRWCLEHSLSILALSPLDIGALVVARRDAGHDPRLTLTALASAYRNKRIPDETACNLARRIDNVWKAHNRERLRPRKQAPVLPLMSWKAMHAAAGDPDAAGRSGPFGRERRARNRLVISLGITGALRPGELGRLSASASHVDADRHLVLPLVPGGSGAVTKTGRPEIIVPLGAAPFDTFPLREDFELLKRLRIERSPDDDHLIADAYHEHLRGGLNASSVRSILRRTAQVAGIAESQALTGHSLRRSMVHIAAAAGWPLDQIAAVLGHNSTKTLENHYLEGYGSNWCRSGEGRQLLLESTRGWADIPANATFTPADDTCPTAEREPWWRGRDLHADRRRAEQLARSAPRVSSSAKTTTARIGRKWEEFCARAGADPKNPSQASLEGFATSLTKHSTARRCHNLHYLKDYFVALPLTDLHDFDEIGRQIAAAVRLGNAITAANRKKGWAGPRRREIEKVTNERMQAVYAQPLLDRIEGIRLLGLVLEQRSGPLLDWGQRQAFRFGEHARVTPDAAMLFAPGASTADTPALTVAPRGGDPLWCGYEAARSLIEHYPQKSCYSKLPPGTLTSRCTPVVRWLQARAAVAVAYATGLRPSDLDGIRWPDLIADHTGAIMWRLPYSKGNLVGNRPQVERLLPSDQPWCPVRALQRLAAGIEAARVAGWQGQTSDPDSDGTVTKVFFPDISQVVISLLMKPAGLDLRLCDFRYHEAARLWEQSQDMQVVRSGLFHRRASTSAGYVARGMTPEMRVATDPVSGMFDSVDG